MKLFDRAKSLLGFEGSARGPFNGMGELGGFYGIESLGDGWQRNLEVTGYGARHVPAVYACVMAIARAISQCYPTHVRLDDNNVRTLVKTSAAYRVLRNPNSYQASPDFLLNLVATALFDGEAFAVVTRNDRYEIDSIHLLPRGACAVSIDSLSRNIFYTVGENPLAPGGAEFIAPARDVLHLRFHTPRHPLIGESPIRAAAMAIGINVALSRTQSAFFAQMNRPSGILSTDQVLNNDQAVRLRSAFDEQSKKWASGGMPILGGGLKFQPLSISSQDAQLIEAQRMSTEDICRVFGVPPPMIGDLSHATLNNSETLIQNFLSMSLGSYLEHIERSFDRLFAVGIHDYIELDTSALLRTDFAGRVDGLTKAVQGGLMTPDEARAREGLSPVPGGDTAFLQRQMVPIDKIGELLDAETEAKLRLPEPPAPPAAPPASDAEAPKPEVPTEEGKDFDVDIAKVLLDAYMLKAAQ